MLTKKFYDILLEDNKIGITELEKADASMGVVFGKIFFVNIVSGYDFLRNYCLINNIELVADYPDEKLISTRTIENLVVSNQNGVEIKALANQISGMDSDEFEVILEGVAYPLFEKEFPNHINVIV